jgi:hypothetical protein
MSENVNIVRLPESDEVKSGDYLIIETPQGTKIVDFSNFILTERRITFSTVLSAHTSDIASNKSHVVTLTGAMFGGEQKMFVTSLSASQGLSACSGGGFSVNLGTLPTSNTGLKTGDLYTQTGAQLGGSGTTKAICIK